MRIITNPFFKAVVACSLLPCSIGCSSDPEPSNDASFAGKTYTLVVQQSSWDELGFEVYDQVPGFLLSLTGSNGAYNVTFGTTLVQESGINLLPGAQQPCNPTAQLTASGDYPNFQLGPVNVPLYLRHPNLDISALTTAYDFTLSNVLPVDGVPASGTLSAVLDVREIYKLFSAVTPNTPERVCEDVAEQELGSCVACPASASMGPGNYCITVTATYVTAQEAPGTVIQPITTPDASCFFE